MRRSTMAALIAALAAAGCGGDERLSKPETAAQLNGAVQAVGGEFRQAFELLGRRAENEKVPADVRERLQAAAAIERRNADEIEEIAPVEGSEAAVDEFVRAARSHADRLDAAAAKPDLTVAEMADTIERGELRDVLETLARQGLVEPPGHQ